jgi:multidrug transporter EmrE-like cation transporter
MNTVERLDGRALLAIAIALLTWSSAYAAIAYALPAFTPGEVAFARLLIGSLCFAALLRVKRVPLPARRDWPQLALLGVLGLTVYHLCLNYAETRIASGTAAILISLVPAATAVVSACWIGERLTLRTWLGLAVALLGMTGGKWSQHQRTGQQQQDEVTHGTPGIRSSRDRVCVRVDGRRPWQKYWVHRSLNICMRCTWLAWSRYPAPASAWLPCLSLPRGIPRRMFRVLAKHRAHDSLHCFVASSARLGCALLRPKNPSHEYR